MTSSQGRTRSKTFSSPPTIKVRVPLIAPGVEPVQGAPRKSMPDFGQFLMGVAAGRRAHRTGVDHDQSFFRRLL